MFLRWPVAALLGMLALHSLSYGFGFVTDPAGMSHEFGANATGSQAATNLTGLVGVMMLWMGALAGLGAYWVGRYACKEGQWIAIGLGAVALSLGAYWATAGSTWDAGFYSIVGGLLIAGGVLLRRGAPEE